MPRHRKPRSYKSRLNVYKKHKEKLRAVVFERDGYACCYCGSTDNLTLDHIIPLVHGGNSRPENLQTLCLRCNRKKGSRDLREDPSDQANG